MRNVLGALMMWALGGPGWRKVEVLDCQTLTRGGRAAHRQVRPTVSGRDGVTAYTLACHEFAIPVAEEGDDEPRGSGIECAFRSRGGSR